MALFSSPSRSSLRMRSVSCIECLFVLLPGLRQSRRPGRGVPCSLYSFTVIRMLHCLSRNGGQVEVFGEVEVEFAFVACLCPREVLAHIRETRKCFLDRSRRNVVGMLQHGFAFGGHQQVGGHHVPDFKGAFDRIPGRQSLSAGLPGVSERPRPRRIRPVLRRL